MQEKIDSMLGNTSQDNIAQDIDGKQIMLRINMLKADMEKKADKEVVNQGFEDIRERIDQL